LPDELLCEIENVLAQVPIDFGGGCSVRKAFVMAWLIRRFRLATTVDIGVYRGRSLFPQAIAHRLATGGVVYGVDPWSAEEAAESDNLALRDAIEHFVATTDFEGLFQEVTLKLKEYGLARHTRIVRSTSARAASRFVDDGVAFDLVHIDGNHDTSAVLRDVRLYLPLVRPGGFVVMDDVSWDSVRPAVREVACHARLLLHRVAPERGDDYAVFQKGGSWLSVAVLSRRLRRLAHP